MSATAIEQGKIVYQVKRQELHDLMLGAARRRREKAAFYNETAEKMDPASVINEDDEDDMRSSYDASAANNLKAAKKSLKDKAYQHEKEAARLEFFASHLAYAEYELASEEIDKYSFWS
jgi:hypothetical protein